MIYRLYKTIVGADGAMTIDAAPQISFLFDPANTDYQKFRKEVAEGVELQNADGVVMTQEQVNEFLKTIPA